MLVSSSTKQRQRKSSTVDKKRALFVGGLPLGTSEKELRAYFTEFGEVSRIDLPVGSSGAKKGFAFIEFKLQNSLEVVFNTSEHYIRQRRVAVRRVMDADKASNLTKDMQNRKLFAFGFPSSANEDSIAKWIYQYGAVSRILSPKGGIEVRGFCYIIMKTKEDFETLLKFGTLDYFGLPITITQAMLRPQTNEEPPSKRVKETIPNPPGSKKKGKNASQPGDKIRKTNKSPTTACSLNSQPREQAKNPSIFEFSKELSALEEARQLYLAAHPSPEKEESSFLSENLLLSDAELASKASEEHSFRSSLLARSNISHDDSNYFYRVSFPLLKQPNQLSNSQKVSKALDENELKCITSKGKPKGSSQICQRF